MQNLAIFEERHIRRIYDEKTETWFFSVIDIVQILTAQSDYQTARKYWNKLKERLKKEGNQSVTNCHRLKLEAADGKKYLTDVANADRRLFPPVAVSSFTSFLHFCSMFLGVFLFTIEIATMRYGCLAHSSWSKYFLILVGMRVFTKR